MVHTVRTKLEIETCCGFEAGPVAAPGIFFWGARSLSPFLSSLPPFPLSPSPLSRPLQARSQDCQNEEADRSSAPSLPFPALSSPSLEVGPLNPARGSGERCKLPQRGLGRSPIRNRFWCILALKSGIWQQF